MPLPPLGPVAVDSSLNERGYVGGSQKPLLMPLDEELAAQAWMFGLDDVTATAPVFVAEPAAKDQVPSFAPPTQADFDRVVQYALADKLTERADLRKRVEVVHNNGEPDDQESMDVAFRALWAVPLVLLADGFNRLSKPVAACCGMTLSRPVARHRASEQAVFLDNDREVPPEPLGEKAAAGKLDDATGSWCEPRLPTVAREYCGAFRKRAEPAAGVASDMATTVPDGQDDASAQVAAPESAQGTTKAGEPPAELAADVAPAEAPASREAAPALAPADSERDRDLDKPKKPRRPGGDRASAISIGGNINSGVGNLLGAYAANQSSSAKPARRKGDDRASAISVAPAASKSAAGALLGAAVGGNGAASSGGPTLAPSTAQSKAESDAPISKPKRKSGESKSVISTNLVNSSSATSNLLGPMMLKQAKSKKRAGDAKSTIG